MNEEKEHKPAIIIHYNAI